MHLRCPAGYPPVSMPQSAFRYVSFRIRGFFGKHLANGASRIPFLSSDHIGCRWGPSPDSAVPFHRDEFLPVIPTVVPVIPTVVPVIPTNAEGSPWDDTVPGFARSLGCARDDRALWADLDRSSTALGMTSFLSFHPPGLPSRRPIPYSCHPDQRGGISLGPYGAWVREIPRLRSG